MLILLCRYTASELPTSFGDTRNQAVEGRFAESQTRAAELSQIPTAASTHGTTIDHAHRVGVARQLGKCGVVALGLQFSAKSGEFLDRLGFPFVSFDPCCFGHKYLIEW